MQLLCVCVRVCVGLQCVFISNTCQHIVLYGEDDVVPDAAEENPPD